MLLVLKERAYDELLKPAVSVRLPAIHDDSTSRFILELLTQSDVLTIEQLEQSCPINRMVLSAYLDILEYYELIIFTGDARLSRYQLNKRAS